MRDEVPFPISLPAGLLKRLIAYGEANYRSGRGPTARSALIKTAVERMLDAEGFGPAKAPAARPRRPRERPDHDE